MKTKLAIFCLFLVGLTNAFASEKGVVTNPEGREIHYSGEALEVLTGQPSEKGIVTNPEGREIHYSDEALEVPTGQPSLKEIVAISMGRKIYFFEEAMVELMAFGVLSETTCLELRAFNEVSFKKLNEFAQKGKLSEAEYNLAVKNFNVKAGEYNKLCPESVRFQPVE